MPNSENTILSVNNLKVHFPSKRKFGQSQRRRSHEISRFLISVILNRNIDGKTVNEIIKAKKAGLKISEDCQDLLREIISKFTDTDSGEIENINLKVRTDILLGKMMPVIYNLIFRPYAFRKHDLKMLLATR